MYYLFTGSNFYPLGGMDDFKGVFHTIEDALQEAFEIGDDWFQIAIFKDGIPDIVRRGTYNDYKR